MFYSSTIEVAVMRKFPNNHKPTQVYHRNVGTNSGTSERISTHIVYKPTSSAVTYFQACGGRICLVSKCEMEFGISF